LFAISERNSRSLTIKAAAAARQEKNLMEGPWEKGPARWEKSPIRWKTGRGRKGDGSDVVSLEKKERRR